MGQLVQDGYCGRYTDTIADDQFSVSLASGRRPRQRLAEADRMPSVGHEPVYPIFAHDRVEEHMNFRRATFFAPLLLLLLGPHVVAGQTADASGA